MIPEEMRACTRSSAPRRNIGSTWRKGCPRDRTAPAVADGDRLGGYCRLSRRDESHSRCRGHLPWAWEMKGSGAGYGCSAGSIRCSQRRRRWIATCARSCCSRCAGRCRDDHQRTMQKIPYPLPKADQDVLKQAAKNILSATNSGSDARLSAAIQVLDMVTLDLRERLGCGSRHDGDEQKQRARPANVSCSASCHTRLGVAVRRKLGAARDGGCDGMDVPGWAVEVKRTEVLTLPLFWAQAKRQAECWAPAGFVLAQVSREVGGIHGPARPRPRDFSAWGDPLSMPLPRWCGWRGLGLENYQIWNRRHEIRTAPLCTLFPRLSGTEFDAC